MIFAKKRRFLGNLVFRGIFIVLSAVAALISVEVAMAAWPVLIPVPMRNFSSGWTLNAMARRKWKCPNSRLCHGAPFMRWSDQIQADEIGFPNKRGQYSQTAMFPIVVLGDSATHGNGRVAWPHYLSQYVDLDILNLAVTGAAPQVYEEALVQYGLKKNPKLIIVGLNPADDFRDAQAYERLSAAGQPYYLYLISLIPKPPRSSSWREWLGFYSNIYSIVRGYRQEKSVAPASRSREVMWVNIKNRRFQAAWNSRTQIDLPFDQTVTYDKVETILRRIKNEASAQGAKVLLVVMGRASLVYEPFIVEGLPDWVRGPIKNEYAQYSRHFQSMCKNLGIFYFDPVPALRAQAWIASGESEDIFIGDHMSDFGHNFLAQKISNHIKKLKLIEISPHEKN